jgi:N4-(beta-N-acetylglucosaminyl)-L-asparaginase
MQDPRETSLSRRGFLAAGAATSLTAAAGAAGGAAGVHASRTFGVRRRGASPPVVVSSDNGERTVKRAFELMTAGSSPTVAVVEGVGIVEADPEDMSVGYGGLPNEECVVQLDASVMDGRSHKAGAVACVENIVHVAQVALRVLDSTDHVLLVGAGARQFARRMGFPEQDLLTDRAREAWVRWRRGLNIGDDWLDGDQRIPLDRSGAGTGRDAQAMLRGEDRAARLRSVFGEEFADFGDMEIDARGVPYTWGTIHCSAVAPDGHVGSVTTTSGLSWKIPGRVGDSPIVGAGMYCHDDVGGAGGTGRGESMIQSCGAYEIVRGMEEGMHPTDACLAALRRIVRNTKRPDLLDERGRPNFGATVYACDKQGRHGGAVISQPGGRRYRAFTENGPERPLCAGVFED